MHWEISDGKPSSVKLHVESPDSMTDPELNAIKEEMVQAFLSPNFKNIAEQHNYNYILGRQIKKERIKENKSTQPFRILLTEHQWQRTHQANIERINNVMREAVSEVINRFSTQLNRHFAIQP